MFKFRQLRRNHRYASWEELANTFDSYRSQERTKVIVAGFGFCGILSGIFSIASMFKYRIDKIDTKIDKLENKIDELENKLENKIDELENKLDKLENKIDTKIDKLDTKFDALFNKLFVPNPNIMAHLQNIQ